MPRPIITLTTDFGDRDHFVGTMKGVILRILPTAQIVDICHQVTPFEIAEAGFVVAQAYRFFPPRTVHVVVVDPGVGTMRRPILVEAAGQYFVGPDNGVFSMIYAREKHKVRHITAERYFLKPVSDTFHGRDIFAPVAAHLRKGIPPSRFGKLIQDYLRSDFFKPVRTGKRYWTGRVLKVDRFGNLITNLTLEDVPDLAFRPFRITVGARVVDRMVRTFAEAEPGELVVIPGSSGFLEIAMNQQSASEYLKCGVGAPVEVMIL